MKQQNNWLKIYLVAMVFCLVAILVAQISIVPSSARTGSLANQAHLAAGLASVAQPGLRFIIGIRIAWLSFSKPGWRSPGIRG